MVTAQITPEIRQITMPSGYKAKNARLQKQMAIFAHRVGVFQRLAE